MRLDVDALGCEKRRVSLGQCSFTLAHGSLRSNNIGDAGAWDVGAALQVNTTLTTLVTRVSESWCLLREQEYQKITHGTQTR